MLLSLEALRDLAGALAPAPATQEAFARAIERAEALDDPTLEGVADPARRIAVEALRDQVSVVRRTAEAELGRALGVAAGFNALDGD